MVFFNILQPIGARKKVRRKPSSSYKYPFYYYFTQSFNTVKKRCKIKKKHETETRNVKEKQWTFLSCYSHVSVRYECRVCARAFPIIHHEKRCSFIEREQAKWDKNNSYKNICSRLCIWNIRRTAEDTLCSIPHMTENMMELNSYWKLLKRLSHSYVWSAWDQNVPHSVLSIPNDTDVKPLNVSIEPWHSLIIWFCECLQTYRGRVHCWQPISLIIKTRIDQNKYT